MSGEQPEDTTAVNPQRSPWRAPVVNLCFLGTIAAVWWNFMGGAPGVALLLWSVSDTLPVLLRKIDSNTPPLPTAVDEVGIARDPETRGKSLRATIDKFYAVLPETRESWISQLIPLNFGKPTVDVSKIVRRYIPDDSNFDEAERVLKAAGLSLSPRWIPPASGPRFDNVDTAVLGGIVRQTPGLPPSVMKFSVRLEPPAAGDFSIVIRIVASLSKKIGVPAPPIAYPFDASKKSTIIDTQIRIENENCCAFSILFNIADSMNIARVRRIAGDAGRFPNGRYETPGISFPVHLIITDDSGRMRFDKIVETQGIVASSFMQLERTIALVGLSQGEYRIQIKPTKDTPELSTADLSLGISFLPGK